MIWLSVKDITSMLAPSFPAFAMVKTVNNTALPPGKICGQRWAISPGDNSDIREGAPPSEGIRDKPELDVSAAMILPSAPQLPPATNAELHKGTEAPPCTETFFNLPTVAKATHCPSGEKKRAKAPSAPVSSVALG
jgi:hypothetical protein